MAVAVAVCAAGTTDTQKSSPSRYPYPPTNHLSSADDKRHSSFLDLLSIDFPVRWFLDFDSMRTNAILCFEKQAVSVFLLLEIACQNYTERLCSSLFPFENENWHVFFVWSIGIEAVLGRQEIFHRSTSRNKKGGYHHIHLVVVVLFTDVPAWSVVYLECVQSLDNFYSSFIGDLTVFFLQYNNCSQGRNPYGDLVSDSFSLVVILLLLRRRGAVAVATKICCCWCCCRR